MSQRNLHQPCRKQTTMPTAPTTTKPASAFILIPIISTLLILLAGCAAQSTFHEALELPQDPNHPIFLDIDIFRGSVTISENPALTQILIKRSFHARRQNLEQFRANRQPDPPLNRSLDFIDYRASFTSRYLNTHQSACIITATTSYPLPEYQWLDLQIQVPALAGVAIRTSHGNVTINNSPAPITVANNQGKITVKTNYTITADIQLITANAAIKLTIPADSTGSVDIYALNNSAQINTPQNQKIPQQSQAHAATTLQPGNNQIILRTTNAKARLNLTAPRQ